MRGRSAVVNLIGAVMVSGAAFVPSTARAGPPFVTDDPDVVDYQHYEILTFSTGTAIRGDTSGVGPAVEFNYGLIPNGEFHIGAPLAFDSPSGRSIQFGYGDTELGFEYRFIGQEDEAEDKTEDKKGSEQVDEKDSGLQVAVYPSVDFPTGDQSRGLGAGHARAFLPVWAQESFGDWTTYGGGGYWINQGGGTNDKNYWFFGWVLQRKVTDNLAIGGELFHQTATTIDGKDSTGFNIGVTYDIDEHNHLLASVGRGFQNASETNLLSWYVGYQITF